MRRIIWTVLAIAAAVAAVSGVVDDQAEAYADRTLKSALVTFAVARTLNGVISAAQGTEIAVEPGGVGVILTVGEILDPVNDLVERFSGVMLVAASSLGLQKILLNITSWWILSAILVAAAIAAVAILWLPSAVGQNYVTAVLRVLLLLLFVRFAVPMLVVGTTWISDRFLASEQAAATAALEATRSEIEDINEEPDRTADAEQSLLDRLGAMIDDSFDSMRVSSRMARLKDSAANASGHIVSLIAIFVLQTMILPVAFLWLFVEGLKGIGGRLARA